MQLPERDSLQFRLAWRLAMVFIVITGLLLIILYTQSRETARLLEAWNLEQSADILLGRLERDANGQWHLNLPSDVKSGEHSPIGFAIHTLTGQQIVAQLPAGNNAILNVLPQLDGNHERFFTTVDPQTGQPYYGLRMLRERDGRSWIVTVVEPEAGEDFVHAVLEEFLFDMAWLIPLIACAVLVIGTISLQRGLQPLRRVSAQAESIEPQKPELRLETKDLPAEVRPLVQAFNHALDRLQAGMEQQRHFTANAAHQLRTPLSILTAGLELLEGDEKIALLRRDAARMNRLVEQLLQVARLDKLQIDVSQAVDLRAVAVQAISDLISLAEQKPCELALEGQSVIVRGNFDALVNALRNLIENALIHTPANSSVVVEVLPIGAIRVCDQGPGIPTAVRERVFERFWREHDSKHSGAGLGLAIVREIMLAHGGDIVIEKADGTGTIFTMKLEKNLAPAG